jgi:type IV secretion system protein VirD4
MIGVLNTLFGVLFLLIESITKGIFEFIVSICPTKRKEGYTADFGKVSDMLFQNGRGFYIGEWSNTLEESHSHMICLGGSGSKKSTAIVFNTILQAENTSLIIMDPSKELLTATAKSLETKGYKILVLDYNNPKGSEGFNVLGKCKAYSDVYRVANILIRNSLEGSAYDYWSQSAEAVIAFFCKYLITYAPPECANLPNVLHLLRIFSYAPEIIDALIVKTDPQLMIEYKALVATPDKTLQSTLATAKTALRIYESPSIGLVTSFNTIEFEEFRKQKCALYICSSASDSYLYRAITATFFESFFSHILSTPPYQKQLPLMFIIDEAATIKISLSQAVALTRKHNTSIATFWQDFNQIEHIYGKNEAVNIFSNCNMKVFMPSGQPLATCKMISELLGKYSYESEGQIRTRELLSVQEVHELNKMLVLIGNKPPLLVEAKQYFEIRRLKKMAELPPYIAQNKLPFEQYPLLPIE